MNHKPSGFLILSKAVEGFLQYKTAEGLSPRSIQSYTHDLKLWVEYSGDSRVNMVSKQNLMEYLIWLKEEYKPVRFSGDKKPLSGKTLRNHWVSLSAFFRWHSEEFQEENPMRGVPAPKFETTPVQPFSKQQIEILLKACEFSRTAKTQDRRNFVMRRPTGKRDRAIILVLLDTGVRARELCSFLIRDVDMSTGRMNLKHGKEGGAKGGRGRVVYLGKTARRALWRYLVERDAEDVSPLFVTKFDRDLSPNSLRLIIKSIGDKVGVEKCHPHRFRHTFAITYLRSGGDIFTLQSLLGHRSLDMVRHYAQVAEIDVAQAHRRASPADNWRL